MTESEFSDLRPYVETEGSCIDMGYRPSASLIRNGWLTEVVRGCWAITSKGQQAFASVVEGRTELTAGRQT